MTPAARPSFRALARATALLLLVCAALAAAAAPAETTTAEAKPPAADKPAAGGGWLPSAGDAQEVEITADTMDMDFAKRTSTFTGNVQVREARMVLQADKMVVYFAENEKLERIECTGNVVIEQPEANRTARAGRAEYDVIKGVITLQDNPSLKMGDSTLSNAGRITYYRDDERVTCDSAPNAERPVIRLAPRSATELPNLFNANPPGTHGN